MGPLDARQAEALARVRAPHVDLTLKQRFDVLRVDFALKAKQAMVDQYARIKELDPKAYLLARMSKASDSTLEASLLYGVPYLDNGVPNVKIDPKGGFAQVMADLKGNTDRFLWWVAANRAERLKAEGRENLFTEPGADAPPWRCTQRCRPPSVNL